MQNGYSFVWLACSVWNSGWPLLWYELPNASAYIRSKYMSRAYPMEQNNSIWSNFTIFFWQPFLQSDSTSVNSLRKFPSHGTVCKLSAGIHSKRRLGAVLLCISQLKVFSFLHNFLGFNYQFNLCNYNFPF